MFTKTVIALAIVFGTVSGSLAATKQYSPNPAWDVFDNARGYVGSDPDPNIRDQLLRDYGRGE